MQSPFEIRVLSPLDLPLMRELLAMFSEVFEDPTHYGSARHRHSADGGF